MLWYSFPLAQTESLLLVERNHERSWKLLTKQRLKSWGCKKKTVFFVIMVVKRLTIFSLLYVLTLAIYLDKNHAHEW